MVSIIVPVYNVKDFLTECICSIQNQTLNNFELLLIDDGSTDGSGALCDGFASEDDRIRVIHTTNGGPSRARNIGIDNAKGEYIAFCDADDVISERFLEIMLGELLEQQTDIVVCGMTRNKEKLDGGGHNRFVLSGEDSFKQFLTQGFFSPSPCDKMYKRDLLREEIRFPEDVWHEDCYIEFKLAKEAKSVSYISDILYWYRMRTDSTMHLPYSNRELDVDGLIDDINKWLSEDERKIYKEEIEFYEFSTKLYILNRLLLKNSYLKGENKERTKKIARELYRFRKNPYLSFRNKITVILINTIPIAYRIINQYYQENQWRQNY